MNKVITINLNGRAYQLEETGYDALQKYLATAEQQLRDNPDKAEILADFEQAIALKCNQHSNPYKTVITAAEVSQIIEEMGPVNNTEDSSTEHASQSSGSGEDSGSSAAGSNDSSGHAKRLYQIADGAFFTGVCAGLAVYLDIDVTFVRLAFIALTILTHGVWILVYVAMILFVPHAWTPEQNAQAHGERFTAQDLLDKAKRKYQELSKDAKKYREEGKKYYQEYYQSEKDREKESATNSATGKDAPKPEDPAQAGTKEEVHKNLRDYMAEKKRAKHQWRAEFRKQRRETHKNLHWQHAENWYGFSRFGADVYGFFTGVFLGILGVAWFLTLVSLVFTGTFFGHTYSFIAGGPVALAVLVTAAYVLISLPLQMSHNAAEQMAHPNPYHHYGPHIFGWFVWTIAVGAIVVAGYFASPGIRNFAQEHYRHYTIMHHQVCIGDKEFCSK